MQAKIRAAESAEGIAGLIRRRAWIPVQESVAKAIIFKVSNFEAVSVKEFVAKMVFLRRLSPRLFPSRRLPPSISLRNGQEARQAFGSLSQVTVFQLIIQRVYPRTLS